MSERYVNGDPCPECKDETLTYDPGEDQTRWEPGQSEACVCMFGCGCEYPVDWDRHCDCGYQINPENGWCASCNKPGEPQTESEN